MTSTTTPTPPAHQFRQKPAPPKLPALEPLWEEAKTRHAKGESLPYAQNTSACRLIMGALSLLGRPFRLPLVELPSELSAFQADKIRRRLDSKLPDLDELLPLLDSAIKGAGKLAKGADLQLRQNLNAVLSMLDVAKANKEVEVAAKINGIAAQAQADADARERAAFAESQKAKVRQTQLQKLAAEEAEYQKLTAQAIEG
jgi:hypothetical protein